MNTIKKVGFACKWIDRPDQVDGIGANDDAKQFNTGTTTITWLNRQSPDVAYAKLWSLMERNILALERLVDRVGNLPEPLRMVRLSSDVLPAFTEPNWRHFWQKTDTYKYYDQAFFKVGELARSKNVKLSFHPGQFVVLGSDKPDVVLRSIEEFEYHATMARCMGYGQKFQDFKINVHIAGRAGAAGVREAYKKLSPEARNCITIENEEMTHGLDTCLTISDLVPIVLDIHHHYIREGEYLEPNDRRVAQVIDSWRGVRPTAHYSISREDIVGTHDTNVMPSLNQLLQEGKRKQKLRAHSDFMWNDAVNRWAYGFWDCFDIMVECKSKNLGAHQLYEFWKELT